MEVIKWILIVAGGVFLAIVALVAIALLWAKWKLSHLGMELHDALKQLADGVTDLPHFRIHLRPDVGFAWHHAEDGEAAVRSLRNRGFAEAGRYTAAESPGIRIVGLVYERESLLAAVYDTHAAGVYVDVVCDYADGRHFTASNVADKGLAKPPDVTTLRYPGATAGELVDHALTQRPAGERLAVTAADFQPRFEHAYAREMDWRARRGGYTADELRRVAEHESPEPVDDDAIEQVRLLFNSTLRSGVDDVLRERFLETSTMSAGEWDRVGERVIFIHDLLGAEEVADLFTPLLPDAEDEEDEADPQAQEHERLIEQIATDARRTTPRQAFARALDVAPGGEQFERLGGVTEPIDADIYVRPTYPYEDED